MTIDFTTEEFMDLLMIVTHANEKTESSFVKDISDKMIKKLSHFMMNKH